MKRFKSVLIAALRITLITLILSFVSLEIFIRILANTTPEGMVLYQGMALRPYAIPVSNIAATLDTYLANEDAARMIYDPQLGWTFAPNHRGIMTINNDGLRANREYDRIPDESILRIAVFGDSYIAGDEVTDDETFPVYLEAALGEHGVQAEVLNFGVSGYGMDQAYLRWLTLGQDFNPDIVMMGFQPENMNRNVNIIRTIATGPGIPLLKPRFIINDNGELQLVNSPTVPPENIIEVLENFDESPLAQYEWHYDERFQASFWNNSYLWSFIKARRYNLNYAENIFVPPLTPQDERVQVTLAIMRQFAEDVAANDQTFLALHIPMRPMLEDYLSGDGFNYQFVIDDLEQDMIFIHGEQSFSAVDDADWGGSGHYTAQANERLADYVADWLVACLDNNSC